MNIVYVNSESLLKPAEIDKTSSPQGVYVRRDIKEVEYEKTDGEIGTKYKYQEAFLTLNEFESYSNELIAKAIKGDDNSEAYENYQRKLDTPIEYPANGFTYKPKWAENIYAGLLQKGALLPQLFPLKIYDSTELEDRAQSMTMEELTALSIFLASAQERYFAEYKAEKAGI